MKTAYKLNWIESEAGWGQRSDGVSLHRSISDAQKYSKQHSTGSREYYFRSDGQPRKVMVSESLYRKIKGTGIKFDDKEVETVEVFQEKQKGK